MSAERTPSVVSIQFAARERDRIGNDQSVRPAKCKAKLRYSDPESLVLVQRVTTDHIAPLLRRDTV
jgi:hypothetical protein